MKSCEISCQRFRCGKQYSKFNINQLSKNCEIFHNITYMPYLIICFFILDIVTPLTDFLRLDLNRHDITEILVKVALNTIKQASNRRFD